MATFTNQARMTYNNTTVTSNVVTGEFVSAVEVTKTATDTVYTVGEPLTYVIALRNAGATALTGLTLTDNLGAYAAVGTTLYPLTYVEDSILVYQDGVLQPTATVTAGPPLTVSGINVTAGGSTVIVYNAIPNEFASPADGGTIDNTVTVTGSTLTTPVTATETVTAATLPRLSIEKRIEPVPVEENGTLTYTFIIRNLGNTPAVATDSVSVTDEFNPILQGLTAALDGVTWTLDSEYTYDEASGTFVTTPGAITVDAATVTQDPTTGAYTVTPGTATLVVTGTV